MAAKRDAMMMFAVEKMLSSGTFPDEGFSVATATTLDLTVKYEYLLS